MMIERRGSTKPPQRRHRLLLGALGVIFLLSATGALINIERDEPPVHFTGPASLIFGIIALAAAFRAARRTDLDPRTRLGWRVIAASTVPMNLTVVAFLVTGPAAFPQPGDIVHLAFLVGLFIALRCFPVPGRSRREWSKATLDAVTVLAGGSMLLWYLVVGPYVAARGASIGVIVAAAAYPVADLVLIFALVQTLLRGSDPAIRRPLRLVATAVLFLVLADGYRGFVQSHPMSADWPPLQYLFWLTHYFLLGVAAIEQCRAVPQEVRSFGPRTNRATNLPYAAIGVGYSLLVFAAVREDAVYPWGGLVLGAVVITTLVTTRQSIVQVESDNRASTDVLTGLANRLWLHDGLTNAVIRAERSGQRLAVLMLDLNGFKKVNDTLGHKAGDQLLIEFANVLRVIVRQSDRVGRLGGDEFAIVLHGIRGVADAESVADRIIEALARPVTVGGTTTQMATSIGIAVSEPGQLTCDDLLYQADVAMYAAKRRSKASTRMVYDARHSMLPDSPHEPSPARQG